LVDPPLSWDFGIFWPTSNLIESQLDVKTKGWQLSEGICFTCHSRTSWESPAFPEEGSIDIRKYPELAIATFFPHVFWANPIPHSDTPPRLATPS